MGRFVTARRRKADERSANAAYKVARVEWHSPGGGDYEQGKAEVRVDIKIEDLERRKRQRLPPSNDENDSDYASETDCELEPDVRLPAGPA